jgi:hypothetical protein
MSIVRPLYSTESSRALEKIQETKRKRKCRVETEKKEKFEFVVFRAIAAAKGPFSISRAIYNCRTFQMT